MTATQHSRTASPRPRAQVEANPTESVLAEVAMERLSQDARWGEQNHRILGGLEEAAHAARVGYAERERHQKMWNDRFAATKSLGRCV